MSQFNLGLKALRRLVEEQDSFKFYNHKLTGELFRGDELAAYHWVTAHLSSYQKLPQSETFLAQFPDAKEVPAVEPGAYYVKLLENRFEYDTLNNLYISGHALLKEDKKNTKKALEDLENARRRILAQQYRQQIVNFKADGAGLVLQNYFHQMDGKANLCSFGWEYLDNMCGGAYGGDVISYVGRPASGKTFFLLYSALLNWRVRKKKVLICSMEMNALALCQRIAAMYAGTNLQQLKVSGYSSLTLNSFMVKLGGVSEEEGELYVVDGNLSAYPEDFYALAAQLGCDEVGIDGAYLMRSKNPRLDRFTRVAENVELMKKSTTELNIPTWASWQLNRGGSKKSKKEGEKPSLEDIGYSDAIGQISTVVLALLQEDGVETINQREIDVMKGRNGEIGKFSVHWNFDVMDFSQVGVAASEPLPLDFV